MSLVAIREGPADVPCPLASSCALQVAQGQGAPSLPQASGSLPDDACRLRLVLSESPAAQQSWPARTGSVAESGNPLPGRDAGLSQVGLHAAAAAQLAASTAGRAPQPAMAAQCRPAQADCTGTPAAGGAPAEQGGSAQDLQQAQQARVCLLKARVPDLQLAALPHPCRSCNGAAAGWALWISTKLQLA